MKKLLYALSIYLMVGVTANAATVLGELQQNSGDVLPSPIVAVGDDLLQTALDSVTGEPATGAVVRDGATGTAREGGGTGTSLWIDDGGSTSTVYNLDVSVNTSGYDIREIRVFTGWDSNRAQAGYELYYSVVGDTNFTLLGTVLSPADQGAANSSADRMFMTRTYDDGGGTIAGLTGVDAIRFEWDFTDNVNGGTRGPVVREIDILEWSGDFIDAAFTTSTENGPAPLEVVFDASGSTSSTNITSYSWDFGDGHSDLGMIVTNTYAAAGDYTAELVVEDANGLKDTNTVAITAYNFVTAALSASVTAGSPPLEVVFDGSASDSNTNIVSYAWNFGDGNSDTGVIVTNTYTTVGDYMAELVVTDANGLMDTNTVAISVNNYVDVDLVVTAEGYTISNAPSFYTNDLAQTEYLSSSATGGNSVSIGHAQLFNGLIGNDDGDTGDAGETTYDSGNTITVNLDVSVNTLGYDITEISTIAGWKTSNGGRSNQGYEILLTFVDDTQAVLAGPELWAPNSPASYWTKVTLVETNGLAMATGVKAVTFNISHDATQGGVIVGREFDILGVPSVPSVPGGFSIAYTNGLDSLTWATDGAFLYSVQKASNLAVSNWVTFTNVVGTPPQTTVDLPAQDQDVEFYRIIAE